MDANANSDAKTQQTVSKHQATQILVLKLRTQPKCLLDGKRPCEKPLFIEGILSNLARGALYAGLLILLPTAQLERKESKDKDFLTFLSRHD